MVEALEHFPWLGVVLSFIFGAIFGSFANVVILRLPEGKDVVKPPSACPKCGNELKWYHNIPIFSWLALRGKCGFCKTPISWRYPLVEFIVAALFAGLYWHIGHQWILIEYYYFAFALVVVSFIDFDHYILPDVFTLSGIVIGLLGAAINPERALWPAFAGVLVGGGFLWAIAYIYVVLRKEEGMGGGDIKLLGWVGAVLGWQAIPFVILCSSIVGSFVGIAMGVATGRGLRSKIPFGPYIALAAILYIFGGDQVGEWYLRLFMNEEALDF